MIVNMYWKNTQNVGDRFCSPLIYFRQMEGRMVHLHDAYKWDGEGDLILGGGGLIGPVTNELSQEAIRKCKGRKIVWGAGHNYYEFKQYPDWLSGCDLVGLRDYTLTSTNWVPCVSCMDEFFSEEYPTERDVLVYDHHDYPTGWGGKFDTVLNNASTMRETLAEIAKSELVITSSYHGAYWAGLLRRRCVVVRPHSCKFVLSKHKAPIAYTMDDMVRKAQEAKIYPDMLEECRNANVEFFEGVMELLSV